MNSKRLNICILHSDPFDPTMPARPAITEIYGECMPRFGHKVTWITPSREEGKEIQEIFFREVHIYVIPRPMASSLPLRIFNFILSPIRKYRFLSNIYSIEKYDIIQVRNDVFGALLALVIGKKYNIPFVFQYSFPMGPYNVRKSKKRYSYYPRKIESYILKRIFHKADLILPISKWMEAELIKEGISKSKMMPLTMGVNSELFSIAKDGTKVREAYKLNESKVILYAGTMDKLRQLNILICAFSKIKEHSDNIKLLMVGEGDDRTNLEEFASKIGIIDDVLFTGQVPYFDMPHYIAAVDVCLSPVPPLSIYKVSSPTKMFEYMAMGKPVVANEEIPEQKEVIEESGGGVLVKFKAESFANGIIEILDDPVRAKEMGMKGCEWVVKNRSYENMAREVEKKYFELLDSYNGR